LPGKSALIPAADLFFGVRVRFVPVKLNPRWLQSRKRSRQLPAANAERKTGNVKLLESDRRLRLIPRAPLPSDAQVGPLLTETDELIRIFKTSIRTGQKTGQKLDFDP
jgi:hypothetical protein